MKNSKEIYIYNDYLYINKRYINWKVIEFENDECCITFNFTEYDYTVEYCTFRIPLSIVNGYLNCKDEIFKTVALDAIYLEKEWTTIIKE